MKINVFSISWYYLTNNTIKSRINIIKFICAFFFFQYINTATVYPRKVINNISFDRNIINGNPKKKCYIQDSEIENFKEAFANIKKYSKDTKIYDPMNEWKNKINAKKKKFVESKNIESCFALSSEEIRSYEIEIRTSIKSISDFKSIIFEKLNGKNAHSYDILIDFMKSFRTRDHYEFCKKYKETPEFNIYKINLLCEAIEYNKKVS